MDEPLNKYEITKAKAISEHYGVENIIIENDYYDDIENNLKTSLDVIFLEVINESNTHNVPDGAESHFKITIVSDIFEDMRPVQRHQKIYEILKVEMKKIHAIAIHPYTTNEWKDISGEDLKSPNCLGGENAE